MDLSTENAPPDTQRRETSPLCSAEYRMGLDELRRAQPPRWMRLGMIWACGVAVVLGVICFLSPMDEYVMAPGEVRPADYAYVFSRATGFLESIEIQEGQSVTKGQILARMDGWEIRKQIAEIDGQIAEAEPELALARATVRKVAAAPVPAEFLFSAVEIERQKEIQTLQNDYLARLKQLEKSGAASSVETMNLRLQLIASESVLKRSQQANDLFHGDYGAATLAEADQRERMIAARLAALKSKKESALKDLQRQEIVAPEDGVILATAPHFPGEKIEAGTALFKITDEEKTQLRLYASEDRIDRIEPGQLVRFRSNNNPDRLAPLATGRVLRVAKDRDLETPGEAATSPGTYRVQVEIENVPYPLAVGATVAAEIVIAKRPFWRLLFMKSAPEVVK